MLSGAAVLVAVIVAAGPMESRPQAQKPPAGLENWIQKNYEAVDVYRSGDGLRALQLLGTLTRGEQTKSVNEILSRVAAIASGAVPPDKWLISWTPRVLRALGAIHLEAAGAASGSAHRNAAEIAEHHLELAIRIFEIAAETTGETDTFAARWVLAMGLELMGDGRFPDAYDMLVPHCGEKQSYAAMLVACGTIHETLGSLPAEQLAGFTEKRIQYPRLWGDATLGRKAPLFGDARPGYQPIGRARMERNYQLTVARKYFERALAADASSTEAMLRLAQVRMQLNDNAEATAILEQLIARPALTDREHYFARLFLGRIRDREKRYDAAAALLADTGTYQTSLIARSHNAQRRGDAREAAALIEQAARLDTDDPWWSYRFGQYWLPKELLKQVREEARK